MSVDILPRPTKALVDEALSVISGHVSGIYPYEPFYLRGSFNILYTAAKDQSQPQIFSSHAQNEAIALCDYFIRCKLDLFYAYVFKAYIQLNFKKQYQSVLQTLYEASQQFIPRSTFSYDFVTDYITIFNYCIQYYQKSMVERKFPLLTMTDIDNSAPKFAFDISYTRQEQYTLPLEDDKQSNTTLRVPIGPNNNTQQTQSNPVPGRTPAVGRGTQSQQSSQQTGHVHATPQAKPHNFQPMSAKMSQSATKPKSGSSESRPNPAKDDYFPAFALPEAEDEDFDLDDSAFSSNEQFYSSPSHRSLRHADPMNTSSLTLQNRDGAYDIGNADLEQMKKELEELEKSRAHLNQNGLIYQISAAVGAVGLASLWVIGKKSSNEGMIKDKVDAGGVDGGVKAPKQRQAVVASTSPVQRPPKPKREQRVKTGTYYNYIDENGQEAQLMRPRRHMKQRESAKATQ